MYENEQPMTGAAQDRGRSFRFPSFYYTNFFSSKKNPGVVKPRVSVR